MKLKQVKNIFLIGLMGSGKQQLGSFYRKSK